MTIKRIIPVALGLAMIAVASVQGYAFMMASNEVAAPEGQLDMVKMVEDLRVDVANEDIACEEKLAKLDEALQQIDVILDSGVEDERGYLVAREAVAAMRLEIPCSTQQELTAAVAGEFAAAPVAAPAMNLAPASFPAAAPCVNCGTRSSGGGGGSSAGGGISGRALLLGGAAAAIAIPLSSSDDDAPGAPVTP